MLQPISPYFILIYKLYNESINKNDLGSIKENFFFWQFFVKEVN